MEKFKNEVKEVKNLEKGEKKMKKTLVVHNGLFHTDDVMCGALVKIMYGDVNIIRAKRGEESLYCNDNKTIVADFGGGKFDHHEKAENREKRESNNVEYAAFGKLFREYYSLIGFNEKFYQKIDQNFISLLDNVDNNGPQAPTQALNILVNSMNEKNIFSEEQDKAFINAVNVFTPMLKAYFDKMLHQQSLENIVEQIKNQKYAIFEEFFPTELLVNTLVQFVIFPGQDEYVVKSVDSSKYPINIAENAKFVHAMKFIAKFEKKEDAIKCIQNNLK